MAQQHRHLSAAAQLQWMLPLLGLLLLCLAPATVSSLPECKPQFAGGQAAFSADCNWRAPIEGAGNLVLDGQLSIQRLPSLIVGSSGVAASPPLPDPDFSSLTVKRLLLDNVALSPPTGRGGVPVLLPLGMFTTAPKNLSLVDTRLVVSPADFASYLDFFLQQLEPGRLTAAAGSINFHTDGKTFMHVPSWSNSNTQLLAVTLVTAPCRISYGPGQATVSWSPQPGCNMLAANNTTLVPLLLRNASIPSRDPLLIRITTNVTLGHGLNGSIPIRRPVILLGLASALTSVDLGMVVNQLNVTGPTASLVWQGLVLENLAPGDTLSSVVAPPYSTTTSTNMWAIYCNRSAAMCVRMNNVTLTIPQEREVNYHLFMYTMHNSPASSLRQLAEFMRTDLGFKYLDFAPSPGNNSMTIKRLLSRSWQFKDVITTSRTFVAPKLPVPPRPFVLTKSGPAPLVQAIQDCATFNAALNYNSSRVFVWRLLKNVSLVDADGRRACDFTSGFVAAPTHLFGQVIADYKRSTAASPTAGGLAALGVSTGPDDAPDADAGGPSSAGDAALPHGDAFNSLSFGFIPGVFELPNDAQDKFMIIQNVTLQQLPQAPLDDSSSTTPKAGTGRRLAQLSATPPGIWTVLLHAWRRSSDNPVLYIADSQLLLPQPEWNLLAQVARSDDSFAMQLQGPAGITLTGVSLHQHLQVIQVGSLQGPGISGNNLWLMPDPTPVSKIPGYTWPSSLAAAAVRSETYVQRSSGSGSGDHPGLPPAAAAGVGVAVAVVGALAIALAALLLLRRRRRRTASAGLLPKSDSFSSSNSQHKDDPSSRCSKQSGSPRSDSGCVDVALPADAKQHSKAGITAKTAAAGGAAAATAAAALGASPGEALAHRLAAGTAQRLAARSGGSRGSSADRAPVVAAGGSVAAASDDALCSKAASTSTGTDADPRSAGTARAGSGSSSTVEQSIAQGLERWSAAVSATTMQLMKRRLQSNNQTALFPSGGSGSGSNSGRIPALPSTRLSVDAGAAAGAHPGAAASAGVSATQSSRDAGAATVELLEVLGQGSFATVHRARWANKDVAVKVMHLPADAMVPSWLEDGGDDSSAGRSKGPSGGGGDAAATKKQWQRQQNAPSSMAIMEAVVSSTMSHPNVVQVFTYMLTPLMAGNAPQQQRPAAGSLGGGHTGAARAQQDLAAADADDSAKGDSRGVISGWQMRVVLEYCPEGTLREALDRKRLPRVPGTTFLQPAVVLSLCHDIAAALLHLHSEGIVHGDLKAGNCLLTAAHLTAGGSGQRCACGQQQEESLAESWAKLGSLPLTAKVADFGLALPLGPTDTHATMLARGTPTHMSPELFMAGRVSKASDVYAFGVLMYEIISGQRAYAGVPIPLLPHEVAMRRLRPEWPRGIPAQCASMQRLAEACWRQEPQDRPSFADILQALEGCCLHTPATRAADASAAPDRGSSTAAAVSAAQPSVPPHHQQQRQTVRLRVPAAGLCQPQQQQDRASPAGRQSPSQPSPRPVEGPADGGGPVVQTGAKNAMSWSEVSYTHGDVA